MSTVVGATTIDFNGLSPNASFTSYSESGFTVSVLSAHWLVDGYGNPGPSVIFENPPDPSGSVALTDAGVPFNLSSIDLYSSTTPIPYTLTGLLAGNAVFTVSGTVPNTFGNFATVSNPHATDLIDRLEVSLSNPAALCCTNPVGFDNVVVAPAIVVAPAVPEPATITLLSIGIGVTGLGIMHRRVRKSLRIGSSGGRIPRC